MKIQSPIQIFPCWPISVVLYLPPTADMFYILLEVYYVAVDSHQSASGLTSPCLGLGLNLALTSLNLGLGLVNLDYIII